MITGGADTFVHERAGDSSLDAPDIITDFNTRDDVIDFCGVAPPASQAMTGFLSVQTGHGGFKQLRL